MKRRPVIFWNNLQRLDCTASNSDSNKMDLTLAHRDNVSMGYLQVSTILLLQGARKLSKEGRGKSEGSLKFTATIKPLEFLFSLVNEAVELRRTSVIFELARY